MYSLSTMSCSKSPGKRNMLNVFGLLASQAWALAGILTFRLLPFASFVAVSGRYSWMKRSLIVALYVPIAFLAALHRATPFIWLVLAYLYFVGAAWVAYELLPYIRSNRKWLAVVVALFWIFPSAFIRDAPEAFFILGWGFALAAYSFGVDTRTVARPPLRDFLFFVLVNPALVYGNRGRPVSPVAVDFKGVARAWAGLFVMYLAIAPISLAHALAVGWSAAGGWGTRALGMPAVGALKFCGEYAAQSGLASLQIGCMGLMGYRLPERYRYPILARSPADFWRRWNTYVAVWAQAYVFIPLMRAAPARWKQGRSALGPAYAVAVVLTFAVLGMLHDAVTVSVDHTWTASKTIWFFAMGLFLVLWEVLALRWRSRTPPSRARSLVGRAVFAIAACCAASHLPIVTLACGPIWRAPPG
jgi:hypothetical protein